MQITVVAIELKSAIGFYRFLLLFFSIILHDICSIMDNLTCLVDFCCVRNTHGLVNRSIAYDIFLFKND